MAIKVETDDDFRKFIELAHLVSEMAKHPGWEALESFWIQSMESDKLSILRGDYSDQAQYKKITGKISGIHLVLDTPKDLAEAVDSERKRRTEAVNDAD